MDDALFTVAIAGHPNSGKSTVFKVLTDIKETTSKFESYSDSFTQSIIEINEKKIRLVDLSDIYSLNPTNSSEKSVVEFLLNTKIDCIVNVIDSTALSRGLELTIELLEFGLPVVVALNMIDEAEKRGIVIDVDKLQQLLSVDVVPISAIYGKGARNLVNSIYKILTEKSQKAKVLHYSSHIELGIRRIEEELETIHIPQNGTKRFYAIKSIENEKLVPAEILEKIDKVKTKVASEFFRSHFIDSYEIFQYERHHLAMKIAEEVSTYRERQKRELREKIDDYLLHPIAGYFYMLLFFLIYFTLIFEIGTFLAELVESPLDYIVSLYQPLKETQPFLWYTLNGAFSGLAGVLGIVLPYFLPLIFITSLIEDTGYFSRIAFLMDGLFHKIGLHGKSTVPFILGFGCSVPAIYSTKIMERRRDRLVTALLIPFIPCSARIAVIFALTSAFAGPLWALVIYLYVLLIISLGGKILSKFISKPTGLVLEIPKLQKPSIKTAFYRTWFKIKDFTKDALLFLIIGSIILGWLEYFHITHFFDEIFSVIITYLLGLPEQLGSTLIFGFLRKELILVMANQAMGVNFISELPLTIEQVIVFIIFIIFYIPCLATFIVLRKEFGIKTALLSAFFSILVATISAFLFRLAFLIF